MEVPQHPASEKNTVLASVESTKSPVKVQVPSGEKAAARSTDKSHIKQTGLIEKSSEATVLRPSDEVSNTVIILTFSCTKAPLRIFHFTL